MRTAVLFIVWQFFVLCRGIDSWYSIIIVYFRKLGIDLTEIFREK